MPRMLSPALARKRKGKAAADGLAEKMASAAAVGDDDVDMDENAGGKTLGERLRAIEQTAAHAPIDGTAPPEKQKLTATDRAVLDAWEQALPAFAMPHTPPPLAVLKVDGMCSPTFVANPAPATYIRT